MAIRQEQMPLHSIEPKFQMKGDDEQSPDNRLASLWSQSTQLPAPQTPSSVPGCRLE